MRESDLWKIKVKEREREKIENVCVLCCKKKKFSLSHVITIEIMLSNYTNTQYAVNVLLLPHKKARSLLER